MLRPYVYSVARSRSAEQLRHRVDREPDQPTDERAVDPDELQISPDGQLEAARRRLRVPTGDRLGDQVANLVAIPLHHRGRQVDHQVVDLGEQGFVRQQRCAELAQATLQGPGVASAVRPGRVGDDGAPRRDRKSTRLNSSHSQISYAVFCLKKKKICTSATPHRGTKYCPWSRKYPRRDHQSTCRGRASAPTLTTCGIANRSKTHRLNLVGRS